jgi:hypothetical protein
MDKRPNEPEEIGTESQGIYSEQKPQSSCDELYRATIEAGRFKAPSNNSSSNGDLGNGVPTTTLLKSVISGDASVESELRQRAIQAVQKLDGLEDMVELSLLLSALSAVRPPITKPQAAVIVLDSGEIMVQVWSRMDASDVYTRQLTDLERTLLTKVFSPKK